MKSFKSEVKLLIEKSKHTVGSSATNETFDLTGNVSSISYQQDLVHVRYNKNFIEDFSKILISSKNDDEKLNILKSELGKKKIIQKRLLNYFLTEKKYDEVFDLFMNFIIDSNSEIKCMPIFHDDSYDSKFFEILVNSVRSNRIIFHDPTKVVSKLSNREQIKTFLDSVELNLDKLFKDQYFINLFFYNEFITEYFLEYHESSVTQNLEKLCSMIVMFKTKSSFIFISKMKNKIKSNTILNLLNNFLCYENILLLRELLQEIKIRNIDISKKIFTLQTKTCTAVKKLSESGKFDNLKCLLELYDEDYFEIDK